MGLFRDLKIGDRVTISGKGISIDLLVKEAHGQDNEHREALVELDGVFGLRTMRLHYNDGLIQLLPDIYVGVRERCVLHTDQIRVPFHFSVSPGYRIKW